MEGQTRENALSLFKHKEDGSYLVEITKSKQFLLVTQYFELAMKANDRRYFLINSVYSVFYFCSVPYFIEKRNIGIVP